MAEKDLWATMRDKVARFGDFERLENMVGVGRPDVNYCINGCEGNIELKWLEWWPSKEDTIIKLKHFTPKQRNWIRRRLRARGRVWVLLEVAKPWPTYLLFHGQWAIDNLGLLATREVCERAAQVYHVGAFPTDHIIGALAGPFR